MNTPNTPPHHDPANDPNRLVDAYLDGTLSPQQLEQLERDLLRDPGVADRFASAMLIDTLLHEKHHWEALVQAAHFDHDQQPGDRSAVSLATALPVLGELVGVGARRLARSQPFWLAAAAVVFALTLWLIGLSTPPAPQPAQGPVAERQTDTARPAAVATLTQTHHAQWSGPATAAPTRGETLHPGQRLTLTAGFAEITTVRGAVVILEASATIELTNHDNAIELHSGKLVGICETPSSKGFVVHTPHMDVTDLGTRFGVDASQPDATEVHVFAGEVEVTESSGSHAPHRLIAGHAIEIDQANNLKTIDFAASAFLPMRGFADRAQQAASWRAQSDALRHDPEMIAYYGVEHRDIVNDKLLNRAQATLGKMDATLGQAGKADSKPTLADGRKPGTHALRFEAEQHDLVRVAARDAQALAGLDQFTIGMWIRPDNTEGLAHHLVTWRGTNARTGPDAINLALVWNLIGPSSNTNAVLFHSDRDGSDFSEHRSADGILPEDGQWMHLVVSFDRGNRAVYVNGTLVAQMPRLGADKITGIDQELLFGAALCHLSETGSYFDGDLDELFILGRVMDEGQVRSLYEGGAATN